MFDTDTPEEVTEVTQEVGETTEGETEAEAN